MPRGSLQLNEVVEVDGTGKIITIPGISLNVEPRKSQGSVNGGVNGDYGDVAPWTEPPSPLTPPPTKRTFGGLAALGLGSKVSFSSLRTDSNLSYSNHPSESTLALPDGHSRISSSSLDQHSIRKAKSSFGLNKNAPRPSSPSSGVAKSVLYPLSGLIGKRSKSRLRAKTLENDGREHPSLRPRTPPLPDVTGPSHVYSTNAYESTVSVGKKKEKDSKFRKRREREKDGHELGASLSVPSSNGDEEVVMTLDTNLEVMDGIVDTSILSSVSPANGALIGKRSSISDDRHSYHSHHSNPSSNPHYTSHLTPIQHSEFNNPFSMSSTSHQRSSSTSSPPRNSSLVNLANKVVDRKISPRTIILEQSKSHDDLNVTIPPTSINGLHGGPDGALNGVNDSQSNSSGSPSVNKDDPPGSWIPPQSWVVQPPHSGGQEAEEEYYSSSDDSLMQNDLNNNRGLGSGSIGSANLEPGGRGTLGGGRPMEFARPSDVDDDDDEFVVGKTGVGGADEHGRRIGGPRSISSIVSSSIVSSSTSTSTGASYGSPYNYAPSTTGSITSVNSYFYSNGDRKDSHSGKRKKLIQRKNSNPNVPLSSSNDDDMVSTTITARSGSKFDLNLGSLSLRRPHPSIPSSSQQHPPLPHLPPSLQGRSLPGVPPRSSSLHSDSTSRQDPSSRFKIRIYRANSTYHVVSCGFSVTVAMLTPKLNAKLLLGEERDTHRLYLRERGRERILGQTERPADIVRRRLEQAGAEVSDGIGLLSDDGLSFLLKFVYKSQVLGTSEQSLGIEDYERVDLSGRSLRTIPVALHQHADQITSLSLSRNPMLDLPLDFIQSTSNSLTELRLSHMALKKVPSNIRYAASLTRLDLSGNRISDLDEAYLDDIPGLRVLKVQSNRLEKLPWYLPRLGSLMTLNISNNKFRTLNSVLCKLKNLRDLDISFNTITELPEDLGLLSNLEHLIMVGNQITSIPSSASSLVSLRRLDCRRNAIGDLTVIGMLPKLEKLSADHNSLHAIDLCLGPCLTMIDASYNEITEMRVVPPGPYTALLSLDVSHAKLSSVSPVALSSLPSLRHLNLSHNSIKVLPSTLGDLDYLEVLSCADNLLEELPEGIGRLRKLEVLDLHENNLTELPGELWACASLTKLNATSNLIEKWGAPSAPPSLTTASDLGNGDDGSPRTSTDLHMHPFPSQRKGSTASVINPPPRLPSLAYALEKLYLGENQLTADALGFLSLFQELKVLNLSFNLIQDLPPTFFKNFVSDSSTSASTSASSSVASPSSQALNQLHSKTCLEELYLSGNKMSTLPTEDLARMTRLTTLFLNGNRLQSLPQELGKVKNLTILDVGSNLLRYNIYNWEFDWNWNFNKNLKYLNLSGNKRLQIRSDNTKLSGSSRHSRIPLASIISANQQSLGGFTALEDLRVLGLIDITITAGHSIDIPDEHEDRRVRTSESTVCGMAYGIADTLGRNDHLNMLDLVHEFSGKNEAIFAIFGRSQPPKAMPAGISGNKIAKFLRDKYVEVFTSQLASLRRDKNEDVRDALRRSFLKINQNLHDMLFSSRKQMQLQMQMQATSSVGEGAVVGSTAEIQDAFVSRGGASGVVLYFRDQTMYVANAGNALAVVSRSGNAEPVSRKHDPYDRHEIARIRAAEGWVSPTGLVNDEIDISRSFGFFHLLPVLIARPDIVTWQLSELDEFVIVANRGLWDFVSYKTAVDIARRERGDPMLAAQKLRDFAMSYGADGSTMIMVISVSDLFRKDEGRSREGSVVDPHIFRPPKTTITDRNLRRLQDEVPPPTGHLALVFTDIRNSTHLWDVNRGMNTAWRLHNTLLRRKLRLCGGYEVKTEGDAFMCAFPTTMAAVWWCLAVQMELLEEDWPLEILECEDGKPIHNVDGRLIARGLSVRMGIHCGTPLCEIDPVNHRMDYFGPMVNRSARINGNAAGGQIMCSEEVIREIKSKIEGGPPTPQSDFQPLEAVDNVRRLEVTIIDVGEVKLKGLELPEHLSLIYPGHLVARHDLRETAEDPDASGSRVQFSVSQIRQLGLVCIRLEALATSRIFREIGDRKASVQTVSVENENDEEEDPLYIFGDPNLLLPPLDMTSSDRDMTLVLDALSGRIENAVAKIREKTQVESVKSSLISALTAKACLDHRTLQTILTIFDGL